MREIFELTIQTDGKCFLSLRTPSNRKENVDGWELNNDDNPLTKSDVTKQLLHMLAEAYYAGYCEANKNAEESISRLLYESKQHRKPNAKITETNDYREST